jgi:hypothetical protein
VLRLVALALSRVKLEIHDVDRISGCDNQTPEHRQLTVFTSMRRRGAMLKQQIASGLAALIVF